LLGMGRGPGNVRTEQLLMARQEQNSEGEFDTYDCLQKYFMPLLAKYNWGSNPLYFYTGQKGIHPTYAQHLMVSNSELPLSRGLMALKNIPSKNWLRYDEDKLSFEEGHTTVQRSESYSDLNSITLEQTVIFIVNGPTSDKSLSFLRNLSFNNSVSVVALNEISPHWTLAVDYVLAVHPLRKITLQNLNDNVGGIIVPSIDQLSMAGQDFVSHVSDNIHFYGLLVRENEFEVGVDKCVIPRLNVFAYGLAVACRKRVKNIYVVGLDGFVEREKNAEIEKVLQIYREDGRRPSITSLTPTAYTLPTKSPYGNLDL